MTNHKNEFAFGRICILLNELEFGLLRLQVSCNEQTSKTCTFSFDQFHIGQKFENNTYITVHLNPLNQIKFTSFDSNE